MTVLLIDNYDSFTFNLMHLLAAEGLEVEVVRNDAITADEIKARRPQAVVISPGPCTPSEAGVSLDILKHADGLPILGVCLGHQAIGQVFGGEIVRTTPMHGKIDLIEHEARGLFHGFNRPIWATRYHSLTIRPETLPDCLDVTARTRDGVIMAVSHKTKCIHGVQFHPESIATENGALMVRNFLKMARGEKQSAPLQISETIDLKPYVVRVSRGEQLSFDEMSDAMALIIEGAASEAQIGAFLTSLHLRGETADELAGAVSAIRARCKPVSAPKGAIDIVGTGGDGSHSLNISTASAIVVAACGVAVAKHGNRSVSSKSGAADVLEELGLNLEAKDTQLQNSFAASGFAFLFAPLHHKAMAKVVPVRRQLGVPTLFNLMGPLLNPANVCHALIGVNSYHWLQPFAEVFGRLGGARCWVVHGEDGYDELSLSAPTDVVEYRDGAIKRFKLTPLDAGLRFHGKTALKGGTARENACALQEVLAGKKDAYRDAVAYNAGAALVIAGKAEHIRAGAEMALAAIDTQKAIAVLNNAMTASKT